MISFSTTAPFEAQHFTVDPRVFVAQPSPGAPSPFGERVDLSLRMVGFEISASMDNAVGQATVTFERGLGVESLSPLNEDSLMRYGNGRPYLDPNCALHIMVSVATDTDASDFTLIFNGRIDHVDAGTGENLVKVACRDFGGYLLNATIPKAEIRGNMDAEAVMAAILVDYDPILDGFQTPFSVPTSPDFFVLPYAQEEMSVLEAFRRIAQQIGWDVRWFLSGTNVLGELRFYDPDRVRSVLDWVFDVNHYERITELAVDDADVRNSWDIYYYGDDGLPVGPIHAEDAASIARYGRRSARIYLNRAENIRSDVAATTFAAAALADSKDPLVSHVVQMPFFPPVELNDWVHFIAFDEYNGGISLAVAGYTHIWSAPQNAGGQGTATTSIQGRAAPIAAYRDYRRSIPPKTIVTTVAPTTQYAPEGTIILVTDSILP